MPDLRNIVSRPDVSQTSNTAPILPNQVEVAAMEGVKDSQLLLDKDYLRKLRADEQGSWTKGFNAIVGGVGSGLGLAIEDVAMLGQGIAEKLGSVEEGEKNMLAQFGADVQESVKEAMPVYSGNDPDKLLSWENIASWETVNAIVEQGLGFGLGGGAIGAGVKGLSKASRAAKYANLITKSQKTGSVGEAIIAGGLNNYAEGKMMGLEAYKEQETKLKAEREQGKNQLTDFEIKEVAAATGDNVVNWNFAFAGIDIAQMGFAMKSIAQHRKMMTAPDWKKSAYDMAKSSTGEGIQEIAQNAMAAEASYQARKNKDLLEKGDTSELFDRLYKASTSDQALYEGVLGFISGGIQHKVMSKLTGGSAAEQKQYENQQAQLSDNEAYIKKGLKSQVRTDAAVEALVADGKEEEAKLLKDMSFDNVVLRNFQKGTTEHLETSLKEVMNLSEEAAKEQGLDENYKEEAQARLTELKDSEKVYVASLRYSNQGEVFSAMTGATRVGKTIDEMKTRLNMELTDIGDKHGVTLGGGKDIWKHDKTFNVEEFLSQEVTDQNKTIVNAITKDLEKSPVFQTLSQLKKIQNAYQERISKITGKGYQKRYMDFLDSVEKRNAEAKSIEERAKIVQEEYKAIVLEEPVVKSTPEAAPEVSGITEDDLGVSLDPPAEAEPTISEDKLGMSLDDIVVPAETEGDIVAEKEAINALSDKENANMSVTEKESKSSFRVYAINTLTEAKNDRDADPNSPLKGKTDEELKALRDSGLSAIGVLIRGLRKKGKTTAEIKKIVGARMTSHPVLRYIGAKGINGLSYFIESGFSDIRTSKEINKDSEKEVTKPSSTKKSDVISKILKTKSLKGADSYSSNMSLIAEYFNVTSEKEVVKQAQAEGNYNLLPAKRSEGQTENFYNAWEKELENSKQIENVTKKSPVTKVVEKAPEPPTPSPEQKKADQIARFEKNINVTGEITFNHKKHGKVTVLYPRKSTKEGQFFGETIIDGEKKDRTYKFADVESIISAKSISQMPEITTLISLREVLKENGITNEQEINAHVDAVFKKMGEESPISNPVTTEIDNNLVAKIVNDLNTLKNLTPITYNGETYYHTTDPNEPLYFVQIRNSAGKLLKDKGEATPEHIRILTVNIEAVSVPNKTGGMELFKEYQGKYYRIGGTEVKSDGFIRAALNPTEIVEKSIKGEHLLKTYHKGGDIVNSEGTPINKQALSQVTKTSELSFKLVADPVYNTDKDAIVEIYFNGEFIGKLPAAKSANTLAKRKEIIESLTEGEITPLPVKITKIVSQGSKKGKGFIPYSKEEFSDTSLKDMVLLGVTNEGGVPTLYDPSGNRGIQEAWAKTGGKIKDEAGRLTNAVGKVIGAVPANGTYEFVILGKEALSAEDKEQIKAILKDAKDLKLPVSQAYGKIIKIGYPKKELKREMLSGEIDVIYDSLGFDKKSIDYRDLKKDGLPLTVNVDLNQPFKSPAIELAIDEFQPEKAPVDNTTTEATPTETTKVPSELKGIDFDGLFSYRDTNQYQPWVEAEETAWFKSRFPNTPLEVLDSLREIGGIDAWGMVANASVYLAKDAKQGTTYHEAMHIVFNHSLTLSQQKDILAAIDAPVTSNTRKSYPNATEAELKILAKEEKLSNDFQTYVIASELEKTHKLGFSRKVKRFFKKLLSYIKFYTKQRLTIEELFFRTQNVSKLVQPLNKANATRFSEKDTFDPYLKHQFIEYLNVTLASKIYPAVLKSEQAKNPKFTEKDMIQKYFKDSNLYGMTIDLLNSKGIGDRIDDVHKGEWEKLTKSAKDKQAVYFEAMRSLSLYGVPINSAAAYEQEKRFEMSTIEEKEIEGWQDEGNYHAVSDKMSAEVKRFLFGTFEYKKADNASGKEKMLNALGLPIMVNPGRMINILASNISNSSSSVHMMEKMGRLAEDYLWAEDLYDNLIENPDIVEKLYLSLGQMHRITPRVFKTEYDKKGNPVKRAIYAAKDSSVSQILTEIKENFNSPHNVGFDKDTSKIDKSKLEKLKGEINEDNVRTKLEDVGVFINGSTFDAIANDKLSMNKLIKGANDLYTGNHRTSFPKIAKVIFNKSDDKGGLAFLNADGERQATLISSNRITRTIGELKDPDVRKMYQADPTRMGAPLLTELDNDPNNSRLLEFSPVGAFWGLDDRKKSFASLTEAEHFQLQLDMFHNGGSDKIAFYTTQLFADSSTGGSMSFVKKSAEDAMDSMRAAVLQEYARIKTVPNETIKSYSKNHSKWLIFPFMEGVEIEINGEIQYQNINIAIEKYINEITDIELAYAEKIGLFKEGNQTILGDKKAFMKQFIANDYLFQSQYAFFFAGDPAFFKGTGDFYKRVKQAWSPVKYLSVSEITGINEHFYVHVINDVTKESSSEFLSNVKAGLEANGVNKDVVKAALDTYSHKDGDTDNISDGQGVIDIHRWKEIKEGQQEWSPALEQTYQNIINDNVKPGDLSIVMNPLKPYFFDFIKVGDIHVPFQVKNSEFVLLPQIAKGNPKLEAMLKLMDDTRKKKTVNGKAPTVSIQFLSTNKVGVHQDRLASDLSTVSPNSAIQLKNASYGIQMAVPEHHIDTDSLLGTQIRKLVVSNINMDADYNGLKGSELVELWNKILKADTLAAWTELEGDMTQDKILDMLKEEIINQGYPEKYLKALETDGNGELKIPLWHPLHVERVVSLVNSIVRNRVTKQKINGGSVPNVTAYGLEGGVNEFGVGKEPVIKFNDDHSISHFEAYYPIWAKDLIPFVTNEDGSINMKKVEAAGIDMGIAYRIPTENKYSMIPMKIIGFSPAGIILPSQMTEVAGLDFDIDKMYAMLFNFKVIDGELKKVEYDNDADPLSQSKEARDNKKLQLMLDVLTNINSIKDQLIPGGYATIIELTGEKGKKEVNGYNPMRASTRSQMHSNFQAGKALIGVSANANAGYALLQHTDITLADPLRLTADIVTDLSDPNTVDGESSIGQVGQILAAVVDNGKDPRAKAMNLNLETADVYMMLTKFYGLRKAFAFMKSPMIQEYADRVALGEESDVVAQEMLGDKKLKDITQDSFPMIQSYVDRLAKDESIDKIYNTATPDIINGMFETFLYYKNNQAKEISELIRLMKIADNGAQSTIGDTLVQVDLFEKVIDKDFKNKIAEETAARKGQTPKYNNSLNYGTFFESDSYILDMIKYGVQQPLANYEKMGMLDYQKGIWKEVRTYIAKQKKFGQASAKEINQIFRGIMSYMAANISPEQGMDLINNFPKELSDFQNDKEAFPDDSPYRDFINALSVKPSKDGSIDVIRLENVSSIDNLMQDRIERQWEQMLKGKDSAIAEKLAMYARFKHGFNFKPGSFSFLQPVDYYLNEGKEFLEGRLAEKKDVNIFMTQFVKNNYAAIPWVKELEVGTFEALPGGRMFRADESHVIRTEAVKGQKEPNKIYANYMKLKYTEMNPATKKDETKWKLLRLIPKNKELGEGVYTEISTMGKPNEFEEYYYEENRISILDSREKKRGMLVGEKAIPVEQIRESSVVKEAEVTIPQESAEFNIEGLNEILTKNGKSPLTQEAWDSLSPERKENAIKYYNQNCYK